ncbi:MAG: hypothetical protein GY751_26250 [Bacteroidetes bacterium]|nr:hypothetical protein [Bacteroidota bacterium]
MAKNRLVAQRVYLAGPIDYAEDDGMSWRQDITPVLESMNIMVMDPTNKMTTNTKYNEVGEEQNNLKKLKELGRWHELRQEMKPIVLVDLRMVEIADFVIAYIDPTTPMCGTWEELFVSLKQRKPTFVVAEGGKTAMPLWLFGRINPDYIFDSFEDLEAYLRGIDAGKVAEDATRWVFFNED